MPTGPWDLPSPWVGGGCPSLPAQPEHNKGPPCHREGISEMAGRAQEEHASATGGPSTEHPEMPPGPASAALPKLFLPLPAACLPHRKSSNWGLENCENRNSKQLSSCFSVWAFLHNSKAGLRRSLSTTVSDMISQVAKSICHLHQQIELILHYRRWGLYNINVITSSGLQT